VKEEAQGMFGKTSEAISAFGEGKESRATMKAFKQEHGSIDEARTKQAAAKEKME
jgi:hypothetical protein